MGKMTEWENSEGALLALVTLMSVIASAALQAYAVQVFVQPANLVSGGFMGIALLVNRLGSVVGIPISTSLALLLLNLPVAWICSKSISIRFTLFSLVQVLTASVLLKVCNFSPLFDDEILNVIFGGVAFGFATVIALRGNASAGGTDFIALYVSNKKDRSIWEYVFAGNVVLIAVYGALFGWEYAGYSIVFQYIATKIISAFHHRYERLTLQITTVLAPQVIEAYIRDFRHGISCVEAVGGYSKKKMYLLHTVISSYELQNAVQLMRQIDDKVIINVFKTNAFYGSFYRKPIK